MVCSCVGRDTLLANGAHSNFLACVLAISGDIPSIVIPMANRERSQCNRHNRFNVLPIWDAACGNVVSFGGKMKKFLTTLFLIVFFPIAIIVMVFYYLVKDA